MANIQDLLFIFVQGFSGAVAGYITNKYAVNMIFKEYTPLKIGGAVKKNKEKFIEEVSELVEKDIINAHTLTGSIKSEEFAKVIDSACMDFIQNSLKEAFKDTKLREVPEVKKSAEQSVVFIEQNLQEELPKLIDNFSNKIELKSILDDKQLENISDRIIDIILEVLESDKKLEEFLSCLYDENKDITLNDILSENAKLKLQSKVVEIINNSLNEVIDDKEKALELIAKIYELLDLKTIISSLEIKLGQKTLEEILGQEGLDSIGELLFNYIQNLLKDEYNRDKLNKIIAQLIEAARGVELTLFEVLPDEISNSIVVYIRENIPKLAPQLFNWLYENKDNIDNMINTAALETVENIEDPSLKGLISKFEAMIPTISQTFKIVDRASDMVMEYELTEEHASKIHNIIVDYLSKTSVGDLVEFAQNKLYMTDEDICDKFIELFNENGTSMTTKLVNSFKEKKASQILNIDLEALFKEKIIPLIYKFIKSKKQSINSYVDSFVSGKLNDILATELGSLVAKEKVAKLSTKLPKWLANYILNNKAICKKYLKDIVNKILDNVDIEKLILENKEDIILVICSKFNSVKTLIFDALKNKEVNDVFEFVRDEEHLGKFLSVKINKGIENNVDKIFENNVKKIIYDNLIKLDEDEICNIAQSFMGKQLKPLSYFGAFLGSIVGLVFGVAINGTIDKFGFYNGYMNTLIACVLMGLVGVFTNIIALWMIFHPYRKNEFVAKIPIFKIFAQGYIPAHKNSFATGMAYFIDNELLKGKRVENLFESKRDEFSQKMYNYVAKNNFSLLVELAKQKKKEVSKFLCEFLVAKAGDNKDKLAKYVSNVVVDFELDDILSRNTAIEKSQEILVNLDKFNDKIIEFAQSKLDKEQPINELLPENIVNSVNNDIDKFIKNNLQATLDNMLKEEFVKELILSNRELYLDFTAKSVGEFIGDTKMTGLKEAAKDNLNDYLIARLPAVIKAAIDDFLQNNLSEEKTLAEIFDGKLKTTIDKKLYVIVSTLLEKVYKFIIENEDKAVELVIGIVRGQLNFFVKLAYEFANGDRLVQALTENIIETKLERFFNESMYSTTKMFSISLNSTIYPTKLEEIGFTLAEVNTGLVVNKFIDSIKADEAIFEQVDEIAMIAIDELKYVKVSEILNNTKLKDLDGVYELLSEEVGFVVDKLNENYNVESTEINNFVAQYVYQNIVDKVFSRTLEDFVDVDTTMEEVFRFALDKLNNSEQSRAMLLDTVGDIYDNKIDGMLVGELLIEDGLAESIEKYLEKIFKDLDFNENNQYICDKIIFNFIESEFRFIEDDTKEYIIKNVISALLSTSIRHTVDALDALKLKKITSEQVELMEAREIHELFKAFAGDFFIKLYMYGSVGFVFGLNIYLSILLGILDLIYSKKIDEIEITSSNIFKE